MCDTLRGEIQLNFLLIRSSTHYPESRGIVVPGFQIYGCLKIFRMKSKDHAYEARPLSQLNAIRHPFMTCYSHSSMFLIMHQCPQFCTSFVVRSAVPSLAFSFSVTVADFSAKVIAMNPSISVEERSSHPSASCSDGIFDSSSPVLQEVTSKGVILE